MSLEKNLVVGLANSPDPLCLINSTTLEFKAVNSAMCHLFGYQEHTFLKLEPVELMLAGTATAAISETQIVDHLVTILRSDRYSEFTLPMVKANGNHFVAEISVKGLKWEYQDYHLIKILESISG